MTEAFGILVSAVLGGLSVYLAIKYKSRGEITFIFPRTIALVDTIVQRLPALTVAYRGDPVGENVVFLNGALLNTGNRDLHSSMVDSSPALELPHGFRWLDVTVAQESEIHSKSRITDERHLYFDINLLKPKEGVFFQCLIQTPEKTEKPPDKLVLESLSGSARIRDTAFRIIKERIGPVSTVSNIAPGLFLVLMALALIILPATNIAEVPAKAYYETKHERENIIVELVSDKHGELRVVRVDTILGIPFQRESDSIASRRIDLTFYEPGLTNYEGVTGDTIIPIFIGGIFLFVGLIFLSFGLFEVLKAKRYKRAFVATEMFH